ncbi:DUF1697 domain-containing protein [Paractinoplanes durhamensis]|uniref:DUF1697 domain-containing protein n=1 Tax=Paractinoplanes durhamensis TaxID=113563 RepID=A0ABQ3YM70_9ACTN|nr:DUF1697 domain-containing protein [Actinoplanes durhamensis]GID98667.1 hypothetical protein Adu01nite_00180 [Actinoplanes durhamensis]
MTVWIALLRAVNLGARNKVPMAYLRDRLAEAGIPGARTHLQSGNVILRSDRESGLVIGSVTGSEIGSLIREVLRADFGLDEPVMVRSHDRLREILAANPFAEAAAERPTLMRVIFLAEHPSPERVKRLEEHDDVRVQDREVYIDYRTGVHGNPLNAAMVARRLALHGTERNWATVSKLAELAETV